MKFMRKFAWIIPILLISVITLEIQKVSAVPINSSCKKIGSLATSTLRNKRVTVVCKLITGKRKWTVQATTTTTTTTTTESNLIERDILVSDQIIESHQTLIFKVNNANGADRNYRIVLPVNYDHNLDYPLALGLHGLGGSALIMQEQSRLENSVIPMIVAYPDGLGSERGVAQSWNAGSCCLPATGVQSLDVNFLAHIITNTRNFYKINSKRVWVFGFSNGGMMGYRLACEIPNFVTGIGVGAGAFTVEGCSPTQAVSVLHISGDRDSKVPLVGGGPYSVVSAETSIGLLAKANSCVSAAEFRDDVDWQCANGASMKLLVDTNQGHDWNENWTNLMIAFLNTHLRN